MALQFHSGAPAPFHDADGIAIYHGDCMKVLPWIDPAEVALVIADPPYGVNRDRMNCGAGDHRPTNLTSGFRYRRNWKPMAGDSRPPDVFHLLRFKRTIIFGAQYAANRLPTGGAWICWDKRPTAQRGCDYGDFELAWTNLARANLSIRMWWSGATRVAEPDDAHGGA